MVAKQLGVGVGRHLLVELYECDSRILNSLEYIREALLKAAVASNSTIINHFFHKFKPQGISGYVLVAESHISIHTWPEYGYAAVDVFTCGEHTDPWRGLEVLRKALKAKRFNVVEVTRGAGIKEQYEGYWRPSEGKRGIMELAVSD